MCGEAYKKLLEKTYEHARAAAWTKGGCATSSPGCDNSQVKINKNKNSKYMNGYCK